MLEGSSSSSVGRPGVGSHLPKDSEPHAPSAVTHTFFTGIEVPGEFDKSSSGYVITGATVRDAANGLWGAPPRPRLRRARMEGTLFDLDGVPGPDAAGLDHPGADAASVLQGARHAPLAQVLDVLARRARAVEL
jgi:hypothetical protein